MPFATAVANGREEDAALRDAVREMQAKLDAVREMQAKLDAEDDRLLEELRATLENIDQLP